MKLLDKLFKKDIPKTATISKEAKEMITKIANARGQALVNLAHSYAIGEGHPERITEANVDRAINTLARGERR